LIGHFYNIAPEKIPDEVIPFYPISAHGDKLLSIYSSYLHGGEQ